MSKSPIKDFSRLIDTHIKTVKKEEFRSQQPSYPSKLLRYDTHNVISELKSKLQASLKHNTRLLDQNSTLSEMANELRYQLKSANEKLSFLQKETDDLLRKTGKERQNLQLELEFKQRNQEEEIAKLLREISLLHQQKNNFEIERQKQIEKLKKQFEGSLLTQLQNIRNCQNNSKQLYEAQIRNLKEALDQKQHQIETIKGVQKLQKNRLNDCIKSLEKQISHIKQTYSVQMRNLKQGFDIDFESQKKRLQNQKEIELSNYNLRIKKLKKDVLEKNFQIQHMSKKMSHQEEQIQMESVQFKRQKDNILSELKSNDFHAKILLTKQKNKLQELNKLEVENLTKLFQTNIEELNSQNFKLKQLIQCKKEELKQLYDQNQRIKESFGKEIALTNSENTYLKNKINTIEVQRKEEMQTFKIKMANLLQNDIKCMSDYYDHQLKTYIQRVDHLQKINAGLRERVFKTIQDNDDIRKNFQIQISKQRARVQDLKIKMASITLQHKQQVSYLGSKVQLTSQTLIRQTEHKEKTKSQYEEEKRKYHYLAESKDRQIAELMTMMETMKRMHEDELKVTRGEKSQLRADLDAAQQNIKKIRASAQEEIKRQEQRLKTISVTNQKEQSQIKQLEDKIQVLQKNQIKMKKQYQHLQLINSSIAQQLGLSKGFIENFQLESNAAIEDERSKMKAFLGTHQIGIRQYFEDKIKSKEKDVDNLRQQLAQKQENIRELIIQYAALEKRFDMMMESNAKLREFEAQVKHLGLDNNLIKNMAELFKK